VLIQWNFWEYFSDIIETQAFWEKRHAGKITLKDARFLREKITGNFEKEGLLKIILDYISSTIRNVSMSQLICSEHVIQGSNAKFFFFWIFVHGKGTGRKTFCQILFIKNGKNMSDY
jgi:hypothetical protein